MAKPITNWPEGKVRTRIYVMGLKLPGIPGTEEYPDLKTAAYSFYAIARRLKRMYKLPDGRGFKRYCLKSLASSRRCVVHLDTMEHRLVCAVKRRKENQK